MPRLVNSKIICRNCRKEFNPYNKTTKYCSRKCYFRSKSKETVTSCQTCGAKIISTKSIVPKYCGQKCYRKNMSVINSCLNCGKEFKVPMGIINRGGNAGRYCSVDCSSQHRSKENNSNWRGGDIHDYNKKQSQLRIIRPIVRERDNYKCTECGATGEGIVLDVHHIVPYRISRDNSLSNLITLCHPCHMRKAGEELQLIKLHNLHNKKSQKTK